MIGEGGGGDSVTVVRPKSERESKLIKYSKYRL